MKFSISRIVRSMTKTCCDNSVSPTRVSMSPAME